MSELNDNIGNESDFSLEKALVEIRQIIEKLQRGELDFDTHYELFSKGMALIQEGNAYLDLAETKIQQLIDGKFVDITKDSA